MKSSIIHNIHIRKLYCQQYLFLILIMNGKELKLMGKLLTKLIYQKDVVSHHVVLLLQKHAILLTIHYSKEMTIILVHVFLQTMNNSLMNIKKKRLFNSFYL